MKTRRDRTAGLFKITTVTKHVSALELVAMFANGESVLEPALDRMRRWVTQIKAHVAALKGAPKGAYSPAVLEFADRCEDAARRVDSLLGTTPSTAEAAAAFMEDAAELADEWLSLQVNAGLESPMRGAIRTSEAGRAGALKRHAAERLKIKQRDDDMVRDAKKLRVANYPRAEIVLRLARKNHVKPSTVEGNPRIRAHLPRTRRTPRP